MTITEDKKRAMRSAAHPQLPPETPEPDQENLPPEVRGDDGGEKAQDPQQPIKVRHDGGSPGRPRGPPPGMPLLMRAEEVMRTLAISRRSLYALVQDGLLDVVHPRPRTTRFKTAQVVKLAETGTKPMKLPNLRNQKKDEIAADAAE